MSLPGRRVPASASAAATTARSREPRGQAVPTCRPRGAAVGEHRLSGKTSEWATRRADTGDKLEISGATRRRASTWTLLTLAAVLVGTVLAARDAAAAPATSATSSGGGGGPLQEQEINLKLRILVPRDQRAPVVSAAALAPALAQHLAAPLTSITASRPAFTSQVSVPAAPSLLESVAALPPLSMQPVSVVSSMSAVASGSSVTVPRGNGQQSYRKLVPVRGYGYGGYGASYQALPVAMQTLQFQYPPAPRYPTAWTRPRPGAALIVGAAAPLAAPAPPPAATAVPQQTSPAAPRPELINITLIRGSKSANKACNCSGSAVSSTTTAAPPPPPSEEPAPVEEDADDEAPPPPPLYHGPPSSTPMPNPWQGYIPQDVLEHAKKVLSNNANGRVKLQKEVDKLHFRQNWKHSNYPKKPVPGVGEDLWGALKDDLADLVKNTDADMKDVDEDSDALHHNHRDPDWDDEPLDPIDDVHAGQQRDEFDAPHDGEEDDTSGQPYFVDFWGNRVPQYENGFSDASDTVEDSRKEYNNHPQGWNPDYPKGLWSQSDEHLQVFSGAAGQQGPQAQQAQSAPNQVRPVYDNGLGEGIEANYNKYVLDNGTWVGPDPDPVPDDDLRNLMQDAVSHEAALQNPSEVYPSYEEVVRYLNSRYRYPVQYPRPPTRPRARPRPRPRPRPPPPPPPPPPRSPRPYPSHMYPYHMPHYPYPLPLPLPPPPQPLPRRPRPQPPPPPNPNLVDVNQLVEALILHKEKERARKQEAESKEAVEEYEDVGGDDEARDVERPVRTSNAHASPPSSTTPRSVCKGLKDVGLDPDGQGMSHVQGVVCSSSFDNSEEEGLAEAVQEGDRE